ncbi:hypothetical protein Tco_1216640 [Tanacetum coccineum]
MEILPESISNSSAVDDQTLRAGNPVKEILLKLNLPDHMYNIIHCKMVLTESKNGNPSFEGTSIQYSKGWYVPQALMSNNVPPYNGFMYLPAMPVACHMFTYTLKDSAQIWWNSQKEGSILNYEDLKAKFWSHFSQQKKFRKTHLAVHNIKQRKAKALEPSLPVEFLSTNLPTTYKGLMEKTYTWIQAREVATNEASNDRREGFNRSRKNPSWDNNKGQKNRDRFFPYRGSKHGLLFNMSKSSKEILITEKAARTFEPPPRMLGNRRSRDMTKYCHFHEDYGMTPMIAGERKKGEKDTSPVKAPILMINKRDHTTNRKSLEELTHGFGEITFPPVAQVNNSSDPVIIKAKILGRQVNRVYMDSGSSCEVIYEHSFLKQKPSIKSLRVDSKVPLVSFSGFHSWPIGEVPLEITIGDSPFSKMETLNFIIVRTRNILLPKDAFRFEERQSYLLETGKQGPFLGHVITKQGIRANPLKVKAVTDLEPPRTLKDVQSLNGKLAALSRFLSKGAEKYLPFFKTLKSRADKRTIQRTIDVEEAFQKMNKLMEILPTLTALIKGDVLGAVCLLRGSESESDSHI